LRTTAYNAGGTAADQSIEGMVRAILATQGPSQTQQMFGAGINDFSKYVANWLANKYPSLAPPKTA
jgi:hypothetical protein